jgi:DNA-binding transcriptional MerR regulator
VKQDTWKVGELAKQTGVTARALRHYDEIGLLSPSARTPAGYRLYAAADVARLQRIKSLQSLGFTLEEIRGLLDRPDFSPHRVVELHLARLKEQIERRRTLYRRLEALSANITRHGDVSVEEIIDTIEVISMTERLDKYYTPEQREEIAERGRALGEAGVRRAEAEWADLIARAKAEMANGTPPTDERVRRLAARWRELLSAFTGGNPAIQQGLNRMWQEETSIQGVDTAEMRRLWEYLNPHP